MNNISFIEHEGKQFVVIDHDNEEFTVMPKSVYDAQLEAANRENNNV